MFGKFLSLKELGTTKLILHYPTTKKEFNLNLWAVCEPQIRGKLAILKNKCQKPIGEHWPNIANIMLVMVAKNCY